MKASEFVEAFYQAASEVLQQLPASAYSWSGSPTNPPATLNIQGSSGGFPIEMLCETYGVYPKAMGWHGACWDVTVFRPDQLKEYTKEFLTSVLGPDARLEIHKANGKPFKHVLHHKFDGQHVADEKKTPFYNWFGAKSVETFRNQWIAAK